MIIRCGGEVYELNNLCVTHIYKCIQIMQEEKWRVFWHVFVYFSCVRKFQNSSVKCPKLIRHFR